MRLSVIVLLAVFAAVVLLVVQPAFGQGRRIPIGEWQDMGEANGVRVYRFGDGNRTCYVTTPGGGITCL